MGADHLTQLIDGFDAKQCEQVTARLKRGGVWQVPSLLLWKWWATDTTEHPTALDLAARRRLYATTMELTRILHRGGVSILAGTDNLEPLQEELAALVAAGLSSLDALRSATSLPAQFLGVADSIGLVKSGFVADLALLQGDPIADISNTRNVLAVVLYGRLHAVSPAWK